MEKKRKPWLSATLSSIVPGLGQLYNGNLRLAILLAAASLFFYQVAIFWLLLSFRGLVATILVACILSVYALAQAWLESRRLGVMPLKAVQKKRFYALFLLCAVGVPELADFITPTPERFATFSIPSGSMIPTLLIGDYVMADTWAFSRREPERGEVIVFHYPKDHELRYVKRMIGLAGDSIEMKQGDLYVNGKKIEDTLRGIEAGDDGFQYQFFTEHLSGHDFTVRKRATVRASAEEEHFGPITVPAGQYFALGDNRDRSNDSRYWGFITKEELIGKMLYLYFSFDAAGLRLRQERFGKTIL